MSSILDSYQSIKEGTWARHVAFRVHDFYGDVLEYLSDHYEDWFMEESWSGDGGTLKTALHLYALCQLDAVRQQQNHPTMQLHEMTGVVDRASFAEAFKEVYEGNELKEEMSRLHADNMDEELSGDIRMKTAQRLVEEYPMWAEMPDDLINEKWDEIWSDISHRASQFRASWRT